MKNNTIKNGVSIVLDLFVDSNDQIIILSEKDINEEGVRFTWTSVGEILVGKKNKL